MLNLKKLFNKKSVSIGQEAEITARRYLENHGLIFITNNYHSRHGEIDLIMQDKLSLTFIEVRYRSQAHYGSSADSVTYHKQQKLITTALHFLQTNPHLQHCNCRFDVVALCQDPQNTATLRIEWIKSAFDAF